MTSQETAAATLENMEAVAEAVVCVAGDKIREHVRLIELRKMIGSTLTREQQDAALLGLASGRLVFVDVANAEVRVRARLMPESTNRPITDEYDQAAYGVGTPQRADLIFLEPADEK